MSEPEPVLVELGNLTIASGSVGREVKQLLRQRDQLLIEQGSLEKKLSELQEKHKSMAIAQAKAEAGLLIELNRVRGERDAHLIVCDRLRRELAELNGKYTEIRVNLDNARWLLRISLIERERLDREVVEWQTQCTGKHGSQMQCVTPKCIACGGELVANGTNGMFCPDSDCPGRLAEIIDAH